RESVTGVLNRLNPRARRATPNEAPAAWFTRITSAREQRRSPSDRLRHPGRADEPRRAGLYRSRDHGLASFDTSSGDRRPFLWSGLEHNHGTRPLPEDHRNRWIDHLVAEVRIKISCSGVSKWPFLAPCEVMTKRRACVPFWQNKRIRGPISSVIAAMSA